MRTIKIFLASSSELKTEEKEFEFAIRLLNDEMIKHKIYFQIKNWSRFGDFMMKTGLQSEYRDSMGECEIFVSLLYSRIGKYTEEEFNNAIERFNHKGNLKYIFTYFKNAPINLDLSSKEQMLKLFAFKEHLQQLGHPFVKFSNTKELITDFINRIREIYITGKDSTPKPQTQNYGKNIFVSYSHNNKNWLNEILLYFKPLQKKGLINVWSDKQIEVGADWKEAIISALKQSKIGLLLVTQDFLASDFITNEEIPMLIQQSETEGTTIIPIILEPCTIEFEEELSKFQFFNSPKSPLSSLNENDRKIELVKLTSAIIELIEKNTAPNKA